MEPRAWVEKIIFSDSTELKLAQDDIIIIVGSNNSGKSEALRGIRDKFGEVNSSNLAVTEISIGRQGTEEELISWLETTTKKQVQPNQDHQYQAFGVGVHASQARTAWNNAQHLPGLSRFFCHLLTAEERLLAANPPGNIAFARDAPQHPIHFLQRDDIQEETLSRQFRRAFGVDIVVHRNAGNQVPLHVGQKPMPQGGQDRVSLDYVLELEKLPVIHTQGDGMRSFAGVLLYTSVGRQTTLLIDEPEAFLHPPQARLLGHMMVSDKPTNRQLFIATHSGDVLRGVLDANSPNVRVVRLRRSNNINICRELDNANVARLWSDPLLRYSNILDGLFHEKVVLCESDSDCRFYAAIIDTLYEDTDERKPDIMLTHCGGKARLPLVIRSLRDLEVPIVVVTDFDVLNDERPLRDIVEAAGGNWATIEADWKIVKQSVDSKKPELNTNEIKNEIKKLLDGIVAPIFPEEIKRRIQEVLRRSSPWSIAKSVGIAFIPNGQPSQACKRLFAALQDLGVFVVPVGELEGFAKTVSGHGPAWVNDAIKKDLKKDPELQAAREFVSRIAQV